MTDAAEARDLPKDVTEIAIQSASWDIWDKKYRLKAKDGRVIDETVDDTYKRVAWSLAQVEETEAKRHEWYEKFVWALRQGAIPAGRITSNAGAQEHKPATSTINCTVSGTVGDSMDDILQKVHEAGLTLKAGCVAPDTTVVTEKGAVTAKRAVDEKHQQMLCYDRDTGRFEMRAIEEHMVTHVPRSENIEIRSNGASLKTSIKHPVLVYRDDRAVYVRADEVRPDDALVHYTMAWTADSATAMQAWFAGAHLGDGSAYEKRYEYKSTRTVWKEKAQAAGKRFIFKIRAAEKEVVERYAEFFRAFCGSRAQVVPTATENGTPVWDYTVASFEASGAAEFIDHQIGSKTGALRVPSWVAENPQTHFLPFLAGLIDTDGTVSKERGSVTIATQNVAFAEQLQQLLGLFGVHGGITLRKPREHTYRGNPVRDSGGAMLKISDSDFLGQVVAFMADTGKRRRIAEHGSQSGQYDRYVMPYGLRCGLEREAGNIGHKERQNLGFYHGYHRRSVVSRIWLERWRERFPHLAEWIDLARTLRPVDEINRELDVGETFYDFTVEEHHNYVAGEAGLMVIHNCGIGYEFSTLRHKGAYVSGAGAYTSGALSFMDIYDRMCFTVSSAGGRRGAQMATFDVGHPDVLDFIRAKREDGRLRQFNLSLLITDEFIEAVRNDADWPLAFPVSPREVEVDGIDVNDPSVIRWRYWPRKEGYVVNDDGLVACRIERTVKAKRLWDMIMTSTYDFAEPGFILIDRVNEMNNNWFDEDIRATNPCGEQPLPPYGACLLGSVNLTKFVREPFTENAHFDWDTYRDVVAIFTRMLDNVVEVNGLPLPEQQKEIMRKRRHGMGFLGLGSTVTMLRMKYGDADSVAFTEEASKQMALQGWRTAVDLADEKGPAPIMDEDFTVTAEMLAKRPRMAEDGYKVGDQVKGRVLMARYSQYMEKVADADPETVDAIVEKGARFTHHSSIAPTGTISLSLANNASNGIEPSFAHHYYRNVIREGRKSKEKVDVFSFELLAYRSFIDAEGLPQAADADSAGLPDYFITADDVTPKQHVDIQGAAQKWVDSSISKTANVPTDYPYEDFKDIYLYAYEQGLKGCTTFRFNPEAFQGVLVKEEDLANTTYRFELADGTTVEAQGGDEIEYDGEMHTAANLYDALKEGYYGKF
ncbi:adenosylcobalamin-dependent ribonucleoside-diphosphate reductase [Aquisalimonas sp. 2447]|uniref:adenosylcobalamin-dependent ribonucleoside-diphosphate reductase n=1 Tax=Aquisalimonas sp. 2447 TaxID=2740807 RepID=UPI0014325F71|nr:adenosylcobalamin-dependent ribonucleoside-diphosphate reductase [Aquisalimonas sp. 2447]QIT54223.1 adenosylcobalamin-dependent ribonucleoside-diphosphate reductase [Aquisalimonas sp. 2447]